MARRLDRRVQRTRKLLRVAMMELILEEGYDSISIQDITDKANLGRATFYLHFRDKDDLLLDVMDQMMSDFIDQVPQLSTTQWRLEDTKTIEKLFDFAADHYDLYRIMIMGSGGITASRQLQHRIAEDIENSILSEIDETGADPQVPPHFLANYFAGSLLATIYWWLENDLPNNVEQIAEMFQKANLLDRETLMGLNQSNLTATNAKNKKKRQEKHKTKRGKEQKTEIAEIEPGEDAPHDADDESEEQVKL